MSGVPQAAGYRDAFRGNTYGPMRRRLWIGCQSGAAHVDDFAIYVRVAQACLTDPKEKILHWRSIERPDVREATPDHVV